IYGTGGFPNQTSNSSNYWVDVTFMPAADTTPPTVTGIAPGNGATNVTIATTVAATFSEAINAATLTTSTFVLRTAANAVVPSTVSYSPDTQIATLTPSQPLAVSTAFNATITGGSSGVKDLAGNPLASNYVWSFSSSGSSIGLTTIGA